MLERKVQMPLKCSIFGHRWTESCICVRQGCGCVAPFTHSSHDWNGCLCRGCLQVRPGAHDWILDHADPCGQVCRTCGQTSDAHDWGDHCTCRRCGMTSHDFTSSIQWSNGSC